MYNLTNHYKLLLIIKQISSYISSAMRSTLSPQNPSAFPLSARGGPTLSQERYL